MWHQKNLRPLIFVYNHPVFSFVLIQLLFLDHFVILAVEIYQKDHSQI